MITAARSRQIRFTMIIQNFAQLEQVYGKEQAETLRGNCGNLIYLVTTELKALEEISKMCGEVKSKKDAKTASTPLVTVTDLQKMKENEVIILRLRMSPFKTKFTPNYKIDWGEKYPKAKYPIRQKEEVHVFDIKQFVKDLKKKKLLEMMNAADDGNGDNKNSFPSNPMMPGIPGGMFTPFGGMMPNNSINNRTNGGNIQSPFGSNAARPTVNPFVDSVDDDDDDGAPVMPSSLNIDDLVKKIDKKIAELEEERLEKEKRDKEEAANKPNTIPDAAIQDNNNSSTNDKPVAEVNENKDINKDQQQISLDLDDDSEDDEFFDDFFDN